jgi:hypothetical protein
MSVADSFSSLQPSHAFSALDVVDSVNIYYHLNQSIT